MNMFRTHRRLILLIVLGVGAAVLSVTMSGRFLSGSLGDDILRENFVRTLVDENNDGTMAAREMRHGIALVLEQLGNPASTFDLDGNAVTNRADLREFVRILRSFRAAVCGDGTRQAGEQCDELPGPYDEVQMITYNGDIPVNWIAEFNGVATNPIPPDSPGAVVQSELEEIVGVGNVSVVKLGKIEDEFHRYRVTFIGQKGIANQPQMTHVQGPVSFSTVQQGGPMQPSTTCSNQCRFLP